MFLICEQETMNHQSGWKYRRAPGLGYNEIKVQFFKSTIETAVQ